MLLVVRLKRNNQRLANECASFVPKCLGMNGVHFFFAMFGKKCIPILTRKEVRSRLKV